MATVDRNLRGAPRRSGPYSDGPRISPQAANTRLTSTTNTLKGVKTGSRSITGRGLANPVSLQRSAITGGPPAGTHRRSRPFAEGVTASSTDALYNSIIGQKPGAPINDAINNLPFDTPNDRGIVMRKPNARSMNINVFHVNMPVFKKKESTNPDTLWHTRNRARAVPYSKKAFYQKRGGKVFGQDTVMTIPALNEMLYLSQMKTPLAKGADKKAKEKYFEQDSMHPMEFIKHWGFDGFVVSQMKGASYRGMRQDVDLHHGMTLAICADGEAAKVFNVWGDKIVRDNQQLWFIVKGIDRTKETERFSIRHGPRWSGATYRVDPQASIGTHPNPTEKMGSQGLTFCDTPVQVIPWTSAIKNEPTDAELEYFDDFGRKMRGEKILVGFNRGVGPSDQHRAATDSYHDAERMISCPEVTIVVNRYAMKKYIT